MGRGFGTRLWGVYTQHPGQVWFWYLNCTLLTSEGPSVISWPKAGETCVLAWKHLEGVSRTQSAPKTPLSPVSAPTTQA